MSKRLKVNVEKTTIMPSGGITKDDFSKTRVRVCSLRVKVICVLCVQCGSMVDELENEG